MNEETLLLITFIIAGLLDFFLYYFTLSNLNGYKMRRSWEAITYKEWLIAILYILPTIIYNAVTPFPFEWLVGALVLILLTIIVVRKQETSYTLDEMLLMFLVSQALIFIVVLPIVILDLMFADTSMIILIIKMIIATTSALFVLNRLDLNKFFIYIIHHLALKLIVLIVSLGTLLTFIYLSTSHNLYTYQILIPSGIFILLVVVGLGYTLNSAHQYAIVVPEKYQNIKRLLMLLNLKSEYVESVEELREMISSTIELMDVKVLKPEPKNLIDESVAFENFIMTSINSLKLNHQSNVEIETKIQYFEPHKKIDATTISYMIGTLLENALEDDVQQRSNLPILIDILSTEHVLLIKVANATGRKTSKSLSNMFIKGYSTKGKVGRGFGLAKLKKFVESHQGEIAVSQEINPVSEHNYITFILNF